MTMPPRRQTTTPKNWLVYSNPSPGEVITAFAAVRAGAIHEDPRHAGISHLLEHLVFRSAGLDIQGRAERMGARINATTSLDTTVYQVTAGASAYKEVLQLLHDIIEVYDVDANTVAQEKKTVLQEKHATSDPATASLYRHSFRATPYAKSVIGDEDTLDAISPAHLRAYHHDRYVRLGVAVCVACPSSKKKAVEGWLRRTFGGFGLPPHDPTFDFLDDDVGRPCVSVASSSPSTGCTVTFRAFPYQRRRKVVLDFLLDQLSGGLDSPWYSRLREEKHHVYRMQLNADNTYADAGIVILQCVSNDDILRVFRTVRAMIKETLQKGLFSSSAHFNRAKRAYVAKKRVEFTSDREALCDALVKDALYEGRFVDSQEEFLTDVLDGLQAGEVDCLCRAVFSRPAAVMLGNNKKNKSGDSSFDEEVHRSVNAFVREVCVHSKSGQFSTTQNADSSSSKQSNRGDDGANREGDRSSVEYVFPHQTNGKCPTER